MVEMAASSSAEDSDVTDPSSSESERSLSLLTNDSEAVEGSYSCFSGEDARRCRFRKAGVNEGNMLDRRPIEDGLLCVGVGGALESRFFGSSFVGVVLRFCSLAGADVGSG